MPPHPDRKPVDPLARRKAPLAAKVAPAMWGGRSCAHDSSHRFTLDGVSLAAARGFVEDAIATMMAEQPPQVITLDQRLRVFTLEVQPGTADHVIIWLWTPLGWFDIIDLRLAQGPTPDSVAVRSRTYSTGFVPLTYTWALTMSAAFCWLPFGGAPVARLEELEALFKSRLATHGLHETASALAALGMDRTSRASCLL